MSDDVLLELVKKLKGEDAGIHCEVLSSGSIIKIHRLPQDEDPSSLLSFSTPIFLVLQELKDSGNLNLVTLTYNEEVLETHSLGLQQILEQEEVNKLVQILNQPYRMCLGVEEERLAEQRIDKLLVERVRSNIVYRSRDCRRVIKQVCRKREPEESEEFAQLCTNCHEISNLGVKTESDRISDPLADEMEMLLPEVPDYETEVIKPKKRVSGMKDKEFPCTIPSCQRSFRRQATRDKHLAQHNSGKLLVRCPSEGCKRLFSEMSDRKMLVHIARLHTTESACSNLLNQPSDIKCKTCDESIGTFRQLQEHERSCKQGATCELCGQVCGSSSSLKVHKRNIHSDDGFVCAEDGCGKKVKTKASLLDHISSVHKNQKLYVCSGCGKDFRYRHQRRMCENKHQGKFIHPCALCNKAFNDKRRYDQHMRTHTGEKPFVCPICSFRCSRMDNLNLHTKKSHGLTWKEAEGMTGISCRSKQLVVAHIEEDQHGPNSMTDLSNIHHINLLIQPKPEPQFTIIPAESLTTQ